MKDYDYSDPLQAGAALVNGVTQLGGIDPAMRDIGRYLDGNKAPVPRFEGMFPRTRENTIGFVKDVFSFRIFSALTKALNVVGDVVADGANMLAGVHR